MMGDAKMTLEELINSKKFDNPKIKELLLDKIEEQTAVKNNPTAV